MCYRSLLHSSFSSFSKESHLSWLPLAKAGPSTSLRPGSPDVSGSLRAGQPACCDALAGHSLGYFSRPVTLVLVSLMHAPLCKLQACCTFWSFHIEHSLPRFLQDWPLHCIHASAGVLLCSLAQERSIGLKFVISMFERTIFLLGCRKAHSSL